MELCSTEAGITLHITGADSAGWACFGIRLPVTPHACYIGIFVALYTPQLLAYRPTLR